MFVCFKVNLGSVDASRLKLDFRKCMTGMETECSDDAGNWLVKKGIAAEVVAIAKPAAIQAVPPERVDNKTKNKDS
jgi:hypothetical protein